jgi:hypothetical protein
MSRNLIPLAHLGSSHLFLFFFPGGITLTTLALLLFALALALLLLATFKPT